VQGGLAWRIVAAYVAAHVAVHRHPLPVAVARLSARRTGSIRSPVQPERLGPAVTRVLWIGPRKPRCLYSALTLYQLLHAQGDDAELVIGLSAARDTKDAHAWVELRGIDLGPAPGRAGHAELVRYGARAP
jgi:hypothetical protein